MDTPIATKPKPLPVVISVAKIQEGAELAKVMMSSFWSNPLWRLVWLPEMTLPEIIEGSIHRTPLNLVKGRDTKRHMKAVLPAGPGGSKESQIVGYARWILPEGLETQEDGTATWEEFRVAEPTDEEMKWCQEEHKKGSDWRGRPKGVSPTLEDGFGDMLERLEKKVMGGEPMLSLDYMTVSPDHFGRGIGTQLVKAGLEKADAMGWKTIVMTNSPSALKVYRNLGFVQKADATKDKVKYGGKGENTEYFLVREPKIVVGL